MDVIYTKEIADKLNVFYNFNEPIYSVCTDSRTISNGCLFIAIEGENFDGHDFIEEALKKGAVCAISHKKLNFKSDKIIYVENTGKALLDIATMYRNKFSPKVIGVTGSVGKTTSKDFISCVLESKYKTLKSAGNENNEIGLPKTVFKLDKITEACIFEMGMSALGEIEALTNVAKPDIAVITNIGVCHMEYLGSQENILKAKLEIVKSMRDNSSLIICGDDDFLKNVKINRLNIIKYGILNSNCDIIAKDICVNNGKTKFVVKFADKLYNAVIPTIGKHNVLNALAAIAVGMQLEISIEQAIKALEKYKPSGMRQKLTNKNDILFMEDCYNASPDSIKAAMKTLGEYPTKGRRIAVLGDMLELGAISDESHKQIGDIIFENNIDEIFTYGENMKLATKRAKELNVKATAYDDKIKMSQDIFEILKKGDIIWFKGSHGMKLEEVIDMIYEKIELDK